MADESSESTELLLKRGLKRARLFEVQKITKRIKMLRQKRGSQLQLEKHKRKCDRLVDDIGIIKDIDLDSLVADIIQTCDDHHDAADKLMTLDEAPSDRAKQLERVKWRLLNSKAFQNTLTSIADMKRQDSGSEEADNAALPAAEVSSENDSQNRDNGFQSEVKSTVSGTSENQQCGSDSVRTTQMSSSKKTHQITRNRPKQVNSRQNKITQARKAKVLKKRARSIVKTSSDGRSQDQRGHRKSSRKQDHRDCKRKSNNQDQRNYGRLGRSGRLERKAGISSMFVGLNSSRQRNQLYQFDRPKNRMGQRARQRLWEEKYGSQANHLSKRKDQSAANTRTSKRRDVKGGGNKRGREAVGRGIDPDLHPSWIASKQRKAQEKCLDKFEGKRTVFTDSD